MYLSIIIRAAEVQRQAMLAAITSPSARERLSRIAIVKPEKARMIEEFILRGAKTGKIREKVTEEQLKGMLEQMSEQTVCPCYFLLDFFEC